MNKLLLSFLLFITFQLATQAKGAEHPWKNGRLEISSNQSFIQHKNGTPFFWLGETGWLLPERTNRDEAAYYLKRCRQAEFNVVQIQVLNGVPSFNAYGQMSHIDGWNFEHIDRKGVYGYWDHLDYIVSQAEREGIYIAMVCIWGGLVKAGLLSEKDAVSYGTFLANRYKDAPNIIWVMGGDIQGDIRPEVWHTLATTIKSIDKNHLMTYHPRGRRTSAQWFSKAPWIDFHTFQSGHRCYNQRKGDKFYPIPEGTEEDNWMYVDSTWAYSPKKPVIDSEPSYEDIPKGLHDADGPRWKDCDVRRYAYWSVFAGSCGHTYGHNSIMAFLKPGTPIPYGDNGKVKYWYEALKDPGFSQMKYLKRLMLSFPYFERIPDQSLISGKNGTRYNRLIATRGRDYLLVYNYTGREMKIDFRKIEGKTKRTYWMDAATGSFTAMGDLSNAIHQLQPPTKGDGVLIAFDATKTYLSSLFSTAEEKSSATAR